MTSFTTISALRNMPQGERSSGSSAAPTDGWPAAGAALLGAGAAGAATVGAGVAGAVTVGAGTAGAAGAAIGGEEG